MDLLDQSGLYMSRKSPKFDNTTLSPQKSHRVFRRRPQNLAGMQQRKLLPPGPVLASPECDDKERPSKCGSNSDQTLNLAGWESSKVVSIAENGRTPISINECLCLVSIGEPCS